MSPWHNIKHVFCSNGEISSGESLLQWWTVWASNRLPSIHVLKCALAKCLSLLLPSYNEAKQVKQNLRSHFLIANAKREHAACSHAHILSLHAAVQSHTETQHHRINCRGTIFHHNGHPGCMIYNKTEIGYCFQQCNEPQRQYICNAVQNKM